MANVKSSNSKNTIQVKTSAQQTTFNIRPTDTNAKIGVSGNQASEVFGVKDNLSEYYAKQSEHWAHSSEIVNGIDYSSKYYAEQSKASAQIVNDVKAETQNLVEGFDDSVQEALNELEEARVVMTDSANAMINMATKDIETAHNNAIANIASTKDGLIDELSDNTVVLKQEINALADVIKDNADSIINRVGLNMFDTVLKDHVLTYEESKGLALQGTWVYKEAIAGERYGYPDFYNTCVKEFKESTTATENNVTVTGTITNNNGVISGFSSANYATVPAVPTNVTSYEIGCKFTVGVLNDTQQGILANSTTNICTPQFCITSANNLNFNHPLSSTEWTGGRSVAIEAGETYWIKAVWQNSVVTAYYKTNKTDWQQMSSVQAETLNWTEALGIGIDTTSLPFSGSIDLNECYIDINGSRWWDGVRLRRHSNGHYYYPISAKATIDSRFNSNGVAWYYGVDEANKRIFLPRNNWFIQMASNSVGSFTDAGLPNITGTTGSATVTKKASSSTATIAEANMSGSFYCTSAHNSTNLGTATGWFMNASYAFDASRSNSIYGKSSTVQPKSVKQLLYICVGNQVQDNSWVNVIEQVKNGAKDIEDKRVQSLSDIERDRLNAITNIERDRKQALTDLTNKENAGISALANASKALRTTQITNCLLEVPQRIKYTLEDGTLTIKAGTVVIVPYGTENLTSQYPKGATFIHENFKVVGTQFADDQFIVWVEVQSDIVSYQTSSDTKANKRPALIDLSRNLISTLMNTTSSNIAFDGTGNNNNYRTDLNIIENTLSGEHKNYVMSFPFMTVMSDTTVIVKSIDCVFNGIGYIGSHVFIDKGVKALAGNYKYNDGTYNNILITTSAFKIYTRELSGNIPLWLDTNGNLTFSSGISYNQRLNVVHTNGNESDVSNNKRCQIGEAILAKGVINSFIPKQAFRAVDHTDMQTQLSDLKTQLTSVVDGQWVKVTPTLLSSATAIGDYTIDLSSILTTANCQYEVLLALRSTQNSDSFTVGLIYVTSSLVDAHSYANVMGTGSDKYQDDEFATGIIPVGSDRKIYMHIKAMKQQTVNLVLFAYRRLGTNK